MDSHRILGLALCSFLASCGADPAPGPPSSPFGGSVTISSALPAGATGCGSTRAVTLTAAGPSAGQVTAAGGDCVTFSGADPAATHRPVSIGSPACPELTAPSPLANGQSYTTPPLAGPKTCAWQDQVTASTGGNPGGY
jgi:hypothetical protein